MIGCAPFPPVAGLTIAFLGNAEDTTDPLSSKTFTSVNFGEAVAERYIVSGISWTRSGANNEGLLTATIGGVSASIFAHSSGDPQRTVFIAANVPTGTSGSIVLGFSGNVGVVAMCAYSVVGLSSATPSASAWDSSANPAESLTVPVGGVAIAIARNLPSGTPTWSGLTSDYSASIPSSVVVTSASTYLPDGASPLAMQASFPSYISASASFATFGPP